MKVAIDGRPLTRRLSGVGSFVLSALDEWSSQCPDWEFEVLTNRELDPIAARRISEHANIVVTVSPLPVLSDIALLWFQFKVGRLVRDSSPDIFWATTGLLPPYLPRSLKTIVTIYDHIVLKHPHTMRTVERFYTKYNVTRSIEKADFLWAISHYSASELSRFYPDRKCKNVFVGCSIDKKRLAVIKDVNLTRDFNLKSPYMLFVGNMEPRKNLKFLLSLMPELAEKGLRLAIVGASGWGETDIERVISEPRFPKDSVRILGYVDSDQLSELYRQAALYISTSLDEGFGLPQLEAMHCGCPVVSSHNSAMVEVVEGAGITVSGWDKADWLDAIDLCIKEREMIVEKGSKRAKEYCWGKVIKGLLSELEQKEGSHRT